MYLLDTGASSPVIVNGQVDVSGSYVILGHTLLECILNFTFS